MSASLMCSKAYPKCLYPETLNPKPKTGRSLGLLACRGRSDRHGARFRVFGLGFRAKLPLGAIYRDSVGVVSGLYRGVYGLCRNAREN